MRKTQHAIAIAFVLTFVLTSQSRAQPANAPSPMWGFNERNTGQSTLVGFTGANPSIAWRKTFDVGTVGWQESITLGANGLIYHPGLYALDAASGQQVWRSDTFQGRDSFPALDIHGHEYAFEGGQFRARDALSGQLLWTGAVRSGSDGFPIKIGALGTIFATELGGNIDAYDASGNLKWQSPAVSWIQYGLDAILPATDASENLYFANGAGLRSFDRNGNLRWTVPYNAFSASRVMLGPSGDVVWQRDGVVEKRDSLSGALLGQFSRQSPLQAMDSAGNLYFRDQANVIKTDHDGQVIWSATHPYVTWPLTVDAVGDVFFGTEQGDIVALSSAGMELWQVHVTDHFPSLMAAPAIGYDGTIYARTFYGQELVAIVPEPTLIGITMMIPCLLWCGRYCRNRRPCAPVAVIRPSRTNTTNRSHAPVVTIREVC